MEQTDIQHLQREVRELRAEVRRMRQLIEGAVVIVVVGLVALFPSLLVITIALGASVLFGFLVSPLRRTILQSLFQKRGTDEQDS